MQIQIKEGGTVRKIECQFLPDSVQCGGRAFPGVEVCEDSFSAECASVAINEGGVLYDTWYSDSDGSFMFAFVVSEATSLELLALRRLGAKPPTGAQIITAHGDRYSVSEDGRLIGRAGALASMACIEPYFTLQASL